MGHMTGRKYRKHDLEQITEIVERGPSLAEIGKELGGLTRERARQILKRRGLHNQWVRAKETRQKKQETHNKQIMDKLPELLSVLEQRKTQLLETITWPERKAAEYLWSAGRTDYRMNYDTLVDFFSRYELSVSREERTTLAEFSDQTGLLFTTIASILRKSGLKTLNKPFIEKRILLSHKEKSMINRCKKAYMPCTDLAYFTGLRSYLISQKTQGEKIPVKKLTAKFFWELKYRTAFEVYEARHLKFKKSEISGLLDIHNSTMDYALQHQREIKETIRHDLSLIYKNKIPEKYQFLFSK